MSLLLTRIRRQCLVGSHFREPASVVSHLVAVQAQDYAGAKWGLSLRSQGVTDQAVDLACDRGEILRTHVMRPTWHFVAAGDIRWLLQLTAPRVQTMNAGYYRAAGLTGRTLARGERILERSLKGRTFLTRAELADRLAKDRLVLSGTPLGYVMMHAELEGLICSGPRRGKQFTYALLEERAAAAARRTMDEALAELTRRYFTTRGPATPHDFAWWSGLTVKQARTGIEMAGRDLVPEVEGGVTRWRGADGGGSRGTVPPVLLLSTYDEIGISYKDRRAMPVVPRPAGLPLTALSSNVLVVNGEVAGRWGRVLAARKAILSIQPFRRLTGRERDHLRDSVARYGAFLGVPAEHALVGPFGP